MTNTITLRWAGRGTSGSSYRIEKTTNNSTWSTVVASRPATAPYISPSSELASDLAYGAPIIFLVDGAAFSSSGWLWVDDALVQWTNQSGNQLTGCVWHSGYGVYAAGSPVFQAHETYTDTVTITNHAVVYRIAHIDADGRASAPSHFWYYAPPAPEDSGICVVVVSVGADLGMKRQAGVLVQAYLATDDQFGTLAGQHLDSNAIEANSVLTNVFGLAFFHCWKNSARVAQTGDAPYTFILKPGPNELKVSVSVIPDRDWVLLSQIAD